MRRSADAPGLAAGLVTVLLWGSAFVGIRAAGPTFSPGALALARLAVSSALLGAAVLAGPREPVPRPRDLAGIAVYGVLFLGVYSVALNTAERRIDAGTAAMVINTGPVLIALLAGVFLGEGFPPGLFAGCLVAFGGTAVIELGATRSGTGDAGSGVLLCVLAALAYAVAVVVQKHVLARVSPLRVTWLGCLIALVACLPYAPALASETRHAGPAAVAWVVYLGAFPTALGFVTWTVALRRSSAGRTGSLNYLIPLVAIGLGWALLGETPPALALAGGVLCLAGVYLARRARPAARSGTPASTPR
jgi:drug/metabolite transporter (DMT)-like permease